MTDPASPVSSASSAALHRLIPVDENPLRNPCAPRWIWASLLLTLLLSLLPWRNWPYAPDMLLAVIAFWALHEPRRVGLTVAFVCGLLLDAHDTLWLGSHAAAYVLAVGAVIGLHRRLLRFNRVNQALHLLALFTLSLLPVHLFLCWLAGRWLG